MAYALTFTAPGHRSFLKLDRSTAARLEPRIAALADDPRPTGCVKLAGQDDLWRIRIGDYRVVYAVNDARRTVEVTVVAHRRDVYR